MNEVLFEVLKAVVVLVIILVSRYGIPLIKLKLEDTKYKWVVDTAKMAVKAAEQTILGDKTGPEKKAIVTGFIKEQLIKKNITMSDKQLDMLIEAAVYTMNKEKS